ncbi:MAG: Tim44-like domain-containing protein, partial [Caldimonas sp.]
RGDQVLSGLAPRSLRVPARWRAPVSLGLGLPLLLGSSPAAAAGSTGVLLGGLTPWVGVVAALWAVLTPGDAGDLAGPATLTTFGALALAGAAWRWRPLRLLRADRVPPAALMSRKAMGPADAAVSLDGAAVLEAARARFLRLQVAWDAGDVQALGHLTTPDMLQELLAVLTTRGSGPSRTDVVTLHAELLGLEELGAAWLASVEFSGLIRESAEQGAVPFRELWMLACEKDGAPSWRLARQQALF